MAFKTKIRVLRAEMNITQEELANRVGVRRETILYLENGKYMPSLKLAYDIAKVFDKQIEEVFFCALEKPFYIKSNKKHIDEFAIFLICSIFSC